MENKKKEKIELQIKVSMTEEGESYFFHNKKQLSRIKFVDGAEERGLELKVFSPKQIQALVLDGYISRLELSRTNYEPVREEIMDLSRALVYAFLYKKFNQELFFEMIQCDCVRTHNRQYPSLLFDEKTKIPLKIIKEKNAAHKNLIVKQTKEILAPVWEEIKNDKKHTPEEVRLYSLMSNKFMSQINSFNWFIIITLSASSEFPQIVSIIRNLLTTYLEKSKIAEYISLMVMELAQNNENTAIRKILTQKYPNKKDIAPLVFNPEIRKHIVKELEERGVYSHISFKIGGGVHSIGKQGRLQITLYSQDDTYKETKDSVETMRQLDLAKHSLTEYYNDLSREEQEGNLGFYYLSYLNDECKNFDIKFESLVNQFAQSDLMVINLTFNI